jgi:hypothetical protein
VTQALPYVPLGEFAGRRSNRIVPVETGILDVVGCGDVSSDTVQRARVEATTLGVGALRLEVVAP